MINILLNRVAAGLSLVLSLGLLAMVGLACVNVALRYVWQVSLLWADETLVFGMITIAFLGTIVVSIQENHLRMELLSRILPARAGWVLRGIELAVTAGVAGFAAWYSLAVIRRLLSRGTLSNMAEVPLWLINGVVLVGLVGMGLVALVRLIQHLSGGRA
ncbi:MAG: TRAP transporter small permease [Qingshengfaniella sp.]